MLPTISARNRPDRHKHDDPEGQHKKDDGDVGPPVGGGKKPPPKKNDDDDKRKNRCLPPVYGSPEAKAAGLNEYLDCAGGGAD